MLFNKKDIIKLLLISIIIACAVLICNMFLNYYLDLLKVKDQVSTEMMDFYDAMVTTCISVVGISGGSMVTVSIVMLIFYIKNYTNAHSKELGTLKALGYSSMNIASKFWIFGASVFVGGVVGYALSFTIMPIFYEAQNSDSSFVHVFQSFNVVLAPILILIPTIFFVLISILFAYIKLKSPALSLIRGETKEKRKYTAIKSDSNKSFLQDISKSIIKQKKLILFFAIFAPFCFSGNVQMGISMQTYASPIMGALMIIIGLIIAVLIMLLSLSSVIKDNEKNIALMSINGYTYQECKKAVLDIYRPYGYIGFILGTFYQFGLLKFMVDVIFKDMSVEKYKFNFVGLLITLVCFIVCYELCMYVFSKRINKVDTKQIMLE